MRIKIIVASLCFFVMAAIHAAPASAAACTQQTVWTTGELETAALLNADPNYLYGTCLQNLDNTNVGSLGFYASQIRPTSTAQGTFGGTTSTVYAFPGLTEFVPAVANNYPYAPVSVVGNDTSVYSTPSGEPEGEYNPAISAAVTQANTGVPVGILSVIQSAYGGNSATIGSDSDLTAGQFYAVLASGSNNSQSDGVYVSSIDNSGASGHPTGKGDAFQYGVYASTLNNSNDPSSSALGYCGTADCLQGMSRVGVYSESKGTYPLVANFRAGFTTGSGGGTANLGNRAYIGFLSMDAINADFATCDAKNVQVLYSTPCKAAYGYLSNNIGIATSSANYGSSATGWVGEHYNGGIVKDVATQRLYYDTTGSSPVEMISNINGLTTEEVFEDGEHSFSGNDQQPYLGPRLADIVANNPYTYSTVINENASNAYAESDYINLAPSTGGTTPAHTFYSYVSSVLTQLGFIAHDGSAHFSNTPTVNVDGGTYPESGPHYEIFRDVPTTTGTITKTFATSYGGSPACTLGQYSGGSASLVSQPSTTSVSVTSTAASHVDIVCVSVP